MNPLGDVNGTAAAMYGIAQPDVAERILSTPERRMDVDRRGQPSF